MGMDTFACLNAPTRHVDSDSFEEAYLRTLKYILSALIAAGLPVRCHADGGLASWPAAEQPGVCDRWPYDELAACVKYGMEGDAQEARRAAELYELINDFAQAKLWWRRAASLGDPDAIDYVRLVLAG